MKNKNQSLCKKPTSTPKLSDTPKPLSRAVERKLFYAAIGWLIGLLCAGYLSCKISIVAAAAGVVFSAAAFFVSRVGKLEKYFVPLKKLMIVCVSFFLAVCCFVFYEANTAAPLERLDGRWITMHGVVTEIVHRDNGDRITVKGRTLNCSATTKISFVADDSSLPECGDEVSVTGKVRIPEDSLTFDKQDYCRALGIFLEGDGAAEITLLQSRKNPLIYHMNALRKKSIAAISQTLPGQDGAFLVAMLCSEKSDLTAATESAVYRAGIGHLFAVSGTHVVILCTFLMTIFDKIMLPLRARSAALMAFLLCFCVYAGGSVSVVRACIMMALNCAAGFFSRQSDGANSLGFAAILVTISCPYAIGSISFQLSFLASFAMNTIAPAICRDRVTSAFGQSTIGLLTVNAVTLPICTINFSEVALISAAANMFIVPICTMALTLCFLFVLLGCKLNFLLYAAGATARGVIVVCGALVRSPFCYAGTFFWEKMTLIAMITALTFILAAVIKRKKAVIYTCVCAYVFAIVGFGICDRLPRKDMVFVFPQRYSAVSVVSAGKEVIIFSSGGLNYNAYSVASKVETLHPDKIFLYTFKEKPTEYNALSEELTGINDYCFEVLPDGINQSGGAQCAFFEDGRLIVEYEGGEVVIDEKGFVVGGERFYTSCFYGVSGIIL